MSLSFAEHLDLLNLHGQVAVALMGRLQPDDPVYDYGSVRGTAEEHWDTQEIWAWSLENPDHGWQEEYVAPPTPTDYAALVAGIGTQIDRLTTALTRLGPDQPMDFFGDPGTAGDVAKLLAHLAVTLAHSISITAGGSTPELSPTVASDGIDELLAHRSSGWMTADTLRHPALIRATDSGEEWPIWVAADSDPLYGDFRLSVPEPPAAVVEGAAEQVLWWLHGPPVTAHTVSITGSEPAGRAVMVAFEHPVPPVKRTRRWFSFG